MWNAESGTTYCARFLNNMVDNPSPASTMSSASTSPAWNCGVMQVEKLNNNTMELDNPNPASTMSSAPSSPARNRRVVQVESLNDNTTDNPSPASTVCSTPSPPARHRRVVQVQRKGSGSSVQSLEEIITCPIHIGILEDARLLSCGHAFCRTCLMKYAEASHKTKGLVCPVCRHESQVPKGGVANFPVAIAQNQVAYYVMEKKCKKIITKKSKSEDKQEDKPVEDNSSVEGDDKVFSSRASLETKSELLKHIVEDICRRTTSTSDGDTASGSKGLGRESRETCIEQLNQLLVQLKEQDSGSCSVHDEAGGSKCTHKDDDENEDTETCNLDQIRSNMKKYSTYKIKNMEVYAKGSSEVWNNKEVSCADIVSDGDLSYCIMVNKTDNTILVHNGKSLKVLEIRLQDTCLMQPCYVRAFKNNLYISGCVSREERMHSLIVSCDLQGSIIRQTAEHETRSADGDEPVFCGFDIDGESQDMVVAKPFDRRVDFLNKELHRTGHSFTFEDLHPHYVAWVRGSKTLWVSCPQEGHILIVDDATGVFRKLTTNQIFNSVPSHIVYTSDQRIIFLDSRQNRVFWIMKQQDYILVQRLSFGSGTHTLLMTSIASLTQGRILLAAVDRLSVAKPNRRISRDSNCVVL